MNPISTAPTADCAGQEEHESSGALRRVFLRVLGEIGDDVEMDAIFWGGWGGKGCYR